MRDCTAKAELGLAITNTRNAMQLGAAQGAQQIGAQRPLEARWLTPSGEELSRAILSRLRAGLSLADLPLTLHDGLVDLRGLRMAAVERRSHPRVGRLDVELIGSNMTFSDIRLDSLDLSGAYFESARFMRTRMTNCRFDGARLRDLRLWAVDVEDCTFVEADLRDSAFGGWLEDRENRFRRVSFARADCRGSGGGEQTYIDCDFTNTRLDGIDFNGARFVRCRFGGAMREVTFSDLPWRGNRSERNELEDCDFSHANFRWVQFRRIDLARAVLPDDPSLILLRNPMCVIDRALETLLNDKTEQAKALRGAFEYERKWLLSGQLVGIINRLDLAEHAPAGTAERGHELLLRAQGSCIN